MTHSVALVKLVLGGLSYSYLSHIPDLAAGDAVVVELPHKQHRLTDFSVGLVEQITSDEAYVKRATKWIVCKVDTTKYDALKAMGVIPDM